MYSVLFLLLYGQNPHVSANVSKDIKLQDISILKKKKNAVFCENRWRDGQIRTADMTVLNAAFRHSFGKVEELENQLYGHLD